MSLKTEVQYPVRALLTPITLIDRYIVARMLRPFAVALGVVLAALLLERVLRLFDLIALKGGPFSVVVELATSLVPYYLGLALPAAFFLAMFLAVAAMDEDNELDVLLAGGWSITRLSRPFFATGLFFAVVSIFLLGLIQPYTRYAYHQLLYAATNAGWDARVQPATFVDAQQGLTLSADSVDISGRALKGVFLRKIVPDGEQVITAQSGFLVLSDHGTKLSLYLADGMMLEDRGSGAAVVVHFTRLKTAVNFSPDAPPFRARGDNERELTLFELHHELGNPESLVPHRRLASEFNARIVRALSLPVLPFLAVPLAMAAKRQRRTSGIIIAALSLLAYHHILQLGESLADIGRLPAIAALWVPFSLFTILCLWLFRNSRERPGDNPMTHAVDWLQDRIAALTRAVKRIRRKVAA